MKAIEIKKVGEDWYDIYIDGHFEQDVVGIEAVHRMIDEVLNPKPQKCLNLPKEMFLPCGIGEITSSWERKQNIGRV